MNFSDQTVLVTGGTRGIGLAMAIKYHQAGAKLILTGKSDVPSTTDLPFKYIKADFSDDDDIISLTAQIAKLPKLDVVVNNAGINIINNFENISAEDFERIYKINLKAPFNICKAAAPIMKKQKFGRILNVASIWSTISKEGRNSYTTAKTGLIGFTRNLGVELAKHNIMVNAISPGFTLTDLTRQSLSDIEIENLEKQIPIGRMANPQEIAEVALFLTNRANTYMAGQNITVDGGFTLV